MKSRGAVAPPSVVFRYYRKQILRHRGLFTFVMLGTIGMQAASLVSPLLLRQFFNTLTAATPSPILAHHLLVTIGWIALALIVGWAARRVQSHSVMYLEARVMGDLYLQAFDYLLGHSYQFFVSQFSGTLTRRVSKYAAAFETLFDGIMTTFVPTFIYVLGAVVVLFIRNHTLGIALFLWAVFFFVLQIYVSRLRQPLRDARAAEDSALTGTLADAISNQNTISLFSAAKHEHGILRKAVDRWHAATMRSWLANDYIWSVQSLLMVGINIGLLWGALYFWQRGELTVGDFVLIQSYLIGIFDNLNNLTPNLRRFYDALADGGEM
ncbi:MAG TPA: ABC transporter transmembrane domain-containing protein, partial [Candidatus Paceibacterota bacterium]|nr:ABC transporter transmembrane domain-containing protein [Candidatus Paceibacterota bacterium]